jgi:transmembrane sensor
MNYQNNKEMNNTGKYTDQEWEELASLLSGEKSDKSDLLEGFLADDASNTGRKWKELRDRSAEVMIDTDRAWQKVDSMINEHNQVNELISGKKRFLRNSFMRVAAAALLVMTLGVTGIYLRNKSAFSGITTFTTAEDQKKMDLLLPDGSRVFLNRNSRMSYRSGFGKKTREVQLTGEAYFEITPDAAKPFVIDAGNASVKVVGTTFNVITSNSDSNIEVFVTSGKVLLSDNSGSKSLLLDPGYVGTIEAGAPKKASNENPNYLSWKTGLLKYNGQKLDIVFSDLKRAYNMNIIADDSAITDFTWTTAPIDNQPEETIINLICSSFNLSYTKEGAVYHLSKK